MKSLVSVQTQLIVGIACTDLIRPFLYSSLLGIIDELLSFEPVPLVPVCCLYWALTHFPDIACCHSLPSYIFLWFVLILARVSHFPFVDY